MPNHLNTIGSHNSFTYLPVKKWWKKPLFFTARCQSKTILELYNKGTRLFDLRLKFNPNPIICHGFIEFESNTLEELLRWLNTKDVFVRVILEFNKAPKNINYLIDKFKEYCTYLEDTYKKIKFCGGRCKYNWKILYRFKYEEPSLDDKYSSVQKPYLIDDWCPWIYASLNNKKNIQKGTDKDYLFIDFI